MGSISNVFETIISEFNQAEFDHERVMEKLDDALSSAFPVLSIKVLIYDDKRQAFHATDRTPILISDDFISLFRKLAPLGKPFMVDEMSYFPISVLKKPIGCIIIKSKMSEEIFREFSKVSLLIMNLASLGASTYINMNPEELLKKNRSLVIGEISGGVLHDLNNVICAILGRAQLAIMKYNRSDDVSDLIEGLKLVEKISKSGGKITKRLRNFSKITGSNEIKEVFLSEVLESAIDILEPKLKEQKDNQGKHILINNCIDDNFIIATDSTAMEEVFFNLLNNSLDAIAVEGMITIEANEDRFNTIITVSDNGMGMSDEVLEKIGTMYFTTKGHNGLGIGISAVKTLLDGQGGSIEFESEEDSGTKATITLPKIKPATKEVETIETDVTFRPSHNWQNILLIEDNGGMREVMEELLQGYGHKVKSAVTGKEGLSSYKDGNYDIVFLDIGLPDVSGIEIAKEIRKCGDDIRIAAITGWDEDKVDKSLFDLTISKPFNINQLQDFLETSGETKNHYQEKTDEKTILWENIAKDVI